MVLILKMVTVQNEDFNQLIEIRQQGVASTC
jgi:hypothetical protein